jgi:hypothetical protein
VNTSGEAGGGVGSRWTRAFLGAILVLAHERVSFRYQGAKVGHNSLRKRAGLGQQGGGAEGASSWSVGASSCAGQSLQNTVSVPDVLVPPHECVSVRWEILLCAVAETRCWLVGLVGASARGGHERFWGPFLC